MLTAIETVKKEIREYSFEDFFPERIDYNETREISNRIGKLLDDYGKVIMDNNYSVWKMDRMQKLCVDDILLIMDKSNYKYPRKDRWLTLDIDGQLNNIISRAIWDTGNAIEAYVEEVIESKNLKESKRITDINSRYEWKNDNFSKW